MGVCGGKDKAAKPLEDKKNIYVDNAQVKENGSEKNIARNPEYMAKLCQESIVEDEPIMISMAKSDFMKMSSIKFKGGGILKPMTPNFENKKHERVSTAQVKFNLPDSVDDDNDDGELKDSNGDVVVTAVNMNYLMMPEPQHTKVNNEAMELLFDSQNISGEY